MNPRALVVEDSPKQLAAIELALQDISKDEDKKKRYGIGQILVTKAGWVAKAKGELEKAANASRPYDVLLLDLGLPLNEGDKDENPRRGLDVMEYARSKGAAKEIIIVSVFTEYKYVANAFRGGAVDFIAKPYEAADLQDRVLNCWDRILLKESARILDERIKRLIHYAQKGLAHRFSACFSPFVQSVVHEVEETRVDFSERLGLDVAGDSKDPLVQRLAVMEKAVENARQEWAKLQATLTSGDERPGELSVEDTLGEIVEGLLPCLTVKRTEVERSQKGETRVLTFQKDVQAVLKEIIVGGLSEIPDRGDFLVKIEITVSVEEKEGRAKVRFADNLPRISEDAANSINSGSGLLPDDRFGRAWGLSVAQHVALRGGGRLDVSSSEQGNLITYFIPLAHHA